MRITSDDLEVFRPAGTVRWDSAGQALVWTWGAQIPTGYVVYLMLVDDDVKKVGIAKDTSSSTFKRRMQDEFGVVRRVILGPIPGRPLPGWRLRPLDPFKKNAPPCLDAGHTVDLFARAYPSAAVMDSEETRLNLRYRGEWTKEGWARDGQRLLPTVE